MDASVDVEYKLAADSFDVQFYMRDVAQDMDSSAELKKHKRSIQAVAEQTAQKLKQNVFQNYALFINTSKEISSLEAEMYQLSHMLNEHEALTRNLSSISVTSSSVVVDAVTDPEKHSIASLLERVEGCSSVTEVPGRFLVYSSQLTELDQGTHEDLQLVQAFLLNDSLMIAAHVRRRKGPVHYRFQTLYELDNMAVVDVKDTDKVQCAFKILMFPDSHLYQAEDQDTKDAWIELLEGTKQKHKTSRDALKREMTAHPFHATPHDSLRKMKSNAQKLSNEDQKLMQQGDILASDWLKDAPENLDVCIAQREFDHAIELIEKTKGYLKNFSDSHALRDVRARINHRITQLSAVLMKELESSPSGSLRGGPKAARRAVGLLIKLGHSAKACELFLISHTHIVQRDLQDVKIEEGATNLYVANLASVFFSGLKDAALEFRRAFGNNYGSYSSFLVWFNNQLKFFCNHCTPIIFTNTSLCTVADCLAVLREECDSLVSIGIDFTFKLMSNFHCYICQALTDAKDELVDCCSLNATPETWQPLDLSKDQPQLAAIMIEMENLGILDFKNKILDGNVVDLSQTTVTFCRRIIQYVSDTMKICVPEILLGFVDCVCDAFRHMVKFFVDAYHRDENIPVSDFILADAHFITDTLLPTVGSSINAEIGVEIPDFMELQERLLLELQGMDASTETKQERDQDPEEQSDDSLA